MYVDTICIILCSEFCSDKVCFIIYGWYVEGKESVVKVVKTYENDRISEVLKLLELRGFQNHKGRNSSG